MVDGRWFDPNAINEYYQQGIKGMRTNINGILDYIRGNDFAQNAINKGREAYNTFFGNQNAEAKAQQGRFQAKGTKETVGPNKVKMSQIQGNIANKGIDPNNLKVPIDPTKEVKINPQTVTKAPKAGFFGKLAGKATPWLVGGLGAWGTISNWNKPGSDLVSRAMDATAPVVGVGAPLLGARFGTPGLVAGSVLGTLGGINNAKQAEIRRQANTPYESGYLNNPDRIRDYLSDYLFREGKQHGLNDEEAKKWVDEQLANAMDMYNYANQKGTKAPQVDELEEVNPGESNSSQWPFAINPNQILGGQYNQNNQGDATGAPGTSVEGSVDNSNPIDNLATLLAIVNGLGNNLPNFNVLSPAEMMGMLSQNRYNPYGYGVQQQQQPTDDNGFTQRVLDRANDIRSIEGIEQDAQNRPELRPKAEIEQPKTSDDIMLQRLAEIGKIANQQNYPTESWGPIRRSGWAKMMGMTPFQIWGDYPNQNTRLKSLYEALGKEYEIRKDIEDRDRIKKAGEALSQKFVDDPMLQYAIASGVDASKIAEMLGISDANKFPYEMAKENLKAQNTLMNTAMTGNNTAYNTLIGKQFDLSTLPFKTQMDILKNYPQYLTPSANTVFEEAGKETRDVRDKATELAKANQNAMVRMAIAEMKQKGQGTKLGDLAKMLELLTNTGSLTPEQALTVAGTYIDLGALQRKNQVGSGVRGLFR